MPGKKINTTSSQPDVANFGATIANCYSMFAGTPEAGLIYDIARGVQSVIFNVFPTPAEDYTAEKARLYNEMGFEDITADTRDDLAGSDEYITEDDYRTYEYDRRLNDYSARIDEAIKSGRYPEGTAQRFALEYAQYNLTRLKNREMFASPGRKNLSGRDYPGVDIMSKGANLGFIPILDDDVVNAAPADNFDLFYKPRDDQKRAAFTDEELQESFKAGGIEELYKTSYGYVDTLQDVKNILGAERPATPQQQKVLKDRLLGDVISLQNEIKKVLSSDYSDPLIQRMYDGLEKNTEDSIFSSQRGYTSNLKALEGLEKYLKSGLPLEGYPEFAEILFNKNTLERNVDELKKYFSNTGDFEDAFIALDDKLAHIPQEGASKAEIDSYTKELGNAARKLAAEYSKFTQNPQKRPADPNLSEQDRRMFESEQQSLLDGLDDPDRKACKFVTEILAKTEKFVADPGGMLYGMQHDLYNDYLQSIEEDRIRIGEELQRHKGMHGSYFSDELKGLIDETIRLCDKDNKNTTPEQITKAIDKIMQKAADETGALMDMGEKERHNAMYHLEPLNRWAENNKAYLGNKIESAKRKGMIADESISSQQLYNGRAGRVQIDEALEKFNTSRLVGKETLEHKLVRESAQRIQRYRQELDGIDKQQNPGEWKNKAMQLAEECKACSEFVDNYIDEKGISFTFAGSDRKQGARDLKKEADALRAGLKKEIEISDRYSRMKETTRHIEHVDDKVFKKKFNDKHAGNLVRWDIDKTLYNKDLPMKEKMDSVVALYSASVESADENIKNMAGEILKDAAFPTGKFQRDLNLEIDEARDFFKDLGKYSIDITADYVKGMQNGDSVYGDKFGHIQLTDDIVNKLCENIENDPRIRRYNNQIKHDDELNDQQKAEKMINADKIRSWYDDGQNERINELSEEDKEIVGNVNEIRDEAIESQKITESRAKELGVPELAGKDLTSDILEQITPKVKDAFIKQEAGRFEEIYKEMYDEKRAQLDAKDIEEANRKEADRLAKEAEYERVRNKQAAAKEARGNGKVNEITIKQLREKSGFKDKAHDNAHERKSISNKNAVQKQNANKPEEEIRRVNSF